MSFDVSAGEIKSIIGPNGAGKSTAWRWFRAQSQPTGAGSSSAGILSRGPRPTGAPRRGLGRTFQHARLIPTLTVYENMVLGASVLGRFGEIEASRVLRQLDLVAGRQAFPEDGIVERRLTEIGSALAANPRLLLLDEPGAGLSSTEIEWLANLLREEKQKGRAIVLVDHIIDWFFRYPTASWS